MTNFDEILDGFPDETKSTIAGIWNAIPDGQKSSFTSLIDQIPKQTNLWKMLLKLSGDQAKIMLGKKHLVAIVGPANVGKSTLYNQFIQVKEDIADVSPVPGTTRENQEAAAGVFSIIDTPGADAVGTLGEKERQLSLQAASDADFLVIMFDAIQGVKKTEQELFQTLTHLRKPYIVVLNKIDMVKQDLQKIIRNTSDNLMLQPQQIIPISAKDSKNLSKVLTAIAVAEPAIMVALGQALPHYRWQLAWRVIVSSASLSSVIALTPLPVIDFIPMVVNQAAMVLSIARIYEYEIDLKRARELVVTFGLGFLGRTLFYELSKFGGVPGWILAAAIAASTTVAMGYASVIWFEKGQRLSNERLKSITQHLTQTLLASLKNLGKRKNRKMLKEEIELSLQSTNFREDSSAFEEIAENETEQEK